MLRSFLLKRLAIMCFGCTIVHINEVSQMKATVFQAILEQINRGESAKLRIAHENSAVIRRFLTNDRLIILGGGHVGLALCQMAKMLDFSITVVDDRPSFANNERFPEADQVICDSFEGAISAVGIKPTDYVCVLTRGHRWDKNCVEAVLSGTMPYYFGMIGSRRRVVGLKENLLELGYDSERIEQLHAPIGLDIGAQTPAEIALSICAEMIQEKRKTQELFEKNTLFAKNADIKMLEFLALGNVPRAMMIVLSSDGSTPVESGAMMAVDKLGNGYGTVGGGISEAEAIKKAQDIIGTGKRTVVEFDMSNEVAEENGMVCGGCMTVLIEDIID